MARRPDHAERSCVVTRERAPAAGLLRFVRAPDGLVVPDVKGRLPGRGVWVTGRRDVVAEAVRRKLFARGLKADCRVEGDLPELVDGLLLRTALSALSMARKAGLVVTGFGKVEQALARGPAVALLHAREAAPDGRRKLMQAMRRRVRAETMDDEDRDEEEDVPLPPVDATAMPQVVAGLFFGDELDLALGGANVIHAALLAGGASTSFLTDAAALARYRGQEPDADWLAGAPGPTGPAGRPHAHDRPLAGPFEDTDGS